MKTYRLNIIALKISIIALIVVIISLYNCRASEHNYRPPGCIQAICTDSGEFIYLSYYPQDVIVKINASDMLELQSYTVNKPGDIILSEDETYLYGLSADDSGDRMFRLTLSDGALYYSQLITGETMGFTMNENDGVMYVCHRTFPPQECEFEHIELIKSGIQDHLYSGKISKLSLADLSLIQSSSVLVFPMSIWYSEYSNKLYVLHETITEIPSDPYSHDGSYTVSVWNPDTMQFIAKFDGGFHSTSFLIPAFGCEWSNDGRYFAIPSSAAQISKFTIRIIDTVDDSIVREIYVPDPRTGGCTSSQFLQKAPDSNYVWSVCDMGEPHDSMDRARVAVRFDTQTYEYKRFMMPEVTSTIGFFDVSPDGRTLYLPQPKKGSLIVTSPGNNSPVCDLTIVTQMPYSGPAPALIEFDASRSCDDDGDELTFHWDFDGDKIFDEPVDDSYTGTSQMPVHAYTESYTGLVYMKVTDNYQGECEMSQIVIVEIE